MNREILRIALPAIIANVTVPLLGLLDTAIAGHIGDASFIGAIAVGSMIFNFLYWNFGFLRMSTSGLTAQAYGAADLPRSAAVLRQACFTALTVATAIIVLQRPLLQLSLWVIAPSPAVTALAVQYFDIVVWGAPAVLSMMAIKGWLLGMQDSRSAMVISIGVNVINIIVSLVAVFVFQMGFTGIAVGTLTSVWVGLAGSVWLVRHRFADVWSIVWRRGTAAAAPLRRFLSVSSDILVRSFLLMLVNLGLVAIGARSGDLILAANALMQQLNTLYAYFLDGVAFAGEALVGKYYGARQPRELNRCVKLLFLWATVMMAVFTVAYAMPQHIYRLLTDDARVVATAMDYRCWCALLPLAGMAAFVWDGVFIGLTRSRGMLIAVATATATFVVLYWALPAALGNHRLWLAYVVYLTLRGVVQTVLYYGRRYDTLPQRR